MQAKYLAGAAQDPPDIDCDPIPSSPRNTPTFSQFNLLFPLLCSLHFTRVQVIFRQFSQGWLYIYFSLKAICENNIQEDKKWKALGDL